MSTSEEFKKYKEKLPKDQQRILDGLIDKHSDECKKLFINEIQRDKLHSTIVNMCAYAFSESGPLQTTGYHFITVDPLYKFRGEKGSKIFDLVIYSREAKRAILIECKSSIGDPRRDILVSLDDQIKNVNDHRAELENEIGGEIADLEYVVCGPGQDIEELGRILQEEPLCLWTVDLYSFTLKLFNLTGSSDGEKTGRLVRRRQLHADELLRRALFEKTESRAQIEGFKLAPTSHICRILSHVLEKVIRDVKALGSNQEKRFWLHELTQILHAELPRVDIDDMQRISREVYQLAMELQMIEAEKSLEIDNDFVFNLKVSPRSLRTLEKEINARYAELKCKERSPANALREYKDYLEANEASLDYHFRKGAS